MSTHRFYAVYLIHFTKNSIEFLNCSELTGPYNLAAAVRVYFARSVLQACMPHETQVPMRVCVVLYLIRSLVILLLIPGI